MMRGAGAMTMGSESSQIPIQELLSQRDDMLLLDCLHDFGAEHAEVGATVPARHPLVDERRGMPTWVGIEMMAQAVLVFSGLELRAQGLAPRIGLLLGVRLYEARVPFFRVDARLKVRAVLSLRNAQGLGVFECTIRERDQLLAQGQVKGLVPKDIDEFLRSGVYG
jgi:predicted hotdog family 3-hydroxylacyl-ACP dehydratase